MKLKLFKSLSQTAWALIFSFIFLFINIVTTIMQKKPHLEEREVVISMMVSLLLSLLLSEGVLRLKDLCDKAYRKKRSSVGGVFVAGKNDLAVFFMTAAVIFICWIPVWLAFYPGLFAYDVIAQIQQIKLSQFSTHHPLLHTLGLGFFYEIIGGKVLNDYTKGIAAAALFQMLAFSLALSYISLFLKRLGIKKVLRYALVCFFAVCPFFSVLSISMTKDVIFAAFLGTLVTSLAYFEIDYDFAAKRKEVKAVFALSLIGSGLLRSNGRYAVWILVLLLGIKCLMQKKKNLLLLGIVALILQEVIGFGLKTALHATGPEKNEMLSIPYQQMAFVYELNYENLEPEVRKNIETLIPYVIDYNRIISDPIKFTGQFEDNKKLFWDTYFYLLKKHPRQYIEAFLQTNLGFLCIPDKTNATVYGVGYERRRGFLQTYTRDGYGVYPGSKFPLLEDLYLKLYCQNDYQNNILTFLPCSMGLYFWLIVLGIFMAIMRKSSCLPTIMFIMALGATTLLGPCAIIRYMLPYVVCLPVVWCVAIYCRKSKEN